MIQVTNQIHYIGIDVAKDKLDVHINTHVIELPNHPKGFRSLLKHLSKIALPHVICEASGSYHLHLLSFLHEHHISISIINPRQVRDFARAKGLLAKTDTIDAHLLSDYGSCMNPQPTEPLPPYHAELGELSDRKSQLLVMVTAESNRLTSTSSTPLRKLINSHIRSLKKQIEKIEELLHHLVKSQPSLKKRIDLISSINSVGFITAVSLLASIPELGSLNRSPASALTGTAPLNCDSGSF
ncbi:MAG: transposase [Verrucomicrobiota bacterium]